MLVISVPFVSASVRQDPSPLDREPAGRVTTPTRRIAFEENVGQTDSRVRFVARSGSATAFVLPDSLVIRQSGRSSDAAKGGPNAANAVRLQFDGAAPDADVTGEEELPGRTNYFTGNDPSQWHTDVRTFARIRARNVYAGVDAVYYGTADQIEYDFVVAPDADPAQIRFAITGGESVSVDESGDLVVETPAGELRQRAPRLYQETDAGRMPVSGGFRMLGGGRVGIAVGGYDAARPLVIDPVISFDRSLAGSVSDTAEDIAVDAIGATYVTGTTTSVDFPTTAGPLEESRGTGQDVFVSKFDASGQILLFSAYVGGTQDERARAVSVANDGGVIIAGDTNSVDFPTVNALQATFGGLVDGYVAKLAKTGTTLTFSTYLGGSGQDRTYDIAVDQDGSIVLCGLAGSSDFPVHMPLFGFGGGGDAFLARLTPSGNTLVFSTFFGGSTFDSAQSVSIDGEGNLLIVGDTDTRFVNANPVVPLPRVNAAQPMYGGRLDAFAAKFSPSAQQLLYSTPLGGRAEDYAVDSCVDATGALYVVGSTSSPDFPVHGPIASTYTSGASKGFLTKLTASGDIMPFSRFVGGSGADVLTAVTLLANGHVAAFGRTGSTDLVCVNEFESELGGLTDGLIVEVSPTDGAILTQSYFGSDLAENFGPGAAEPAGGVVAALNVDVSPAVNPELGLGGSTEVRVVRLFLQNGVAPPVPPSSLSAFPSAPLLIRLNWADANENETAFAIERRDEPAAAPWIRVGLTQSDVRVFYDDTVSASTSYFYRVRTLAGPDESQPSVEAGATSLPSNGLPAAPAFLSAAPVAGPHVAIGWSDTSRDETGFEIERRLEPAGAWLPLGAVGAGAVSFRDTSPVVPATHGYRVRAINGIGPSAWSNIATATTVNLPAPPPSPPALLQDLQYAPSEVIVSWTVGTGAITAYRVERRDSGDPTWRVIRSVPWQITAIRDPYVSRDVTYDYRIRAVNSAGVSVPTSESSITVVPPPTPTAAADEILPGLVEISTTSFLGGATGVVFERRTGLTGPFEFLGRTLGTGRFNDRTVLPDSTYTYRIRSFYGSFPNEQLAIFSDFSNETTITTTGPGPVGATITVTSVADGNVRDGALTLREAMHIAEGALPIANLTPQEQALVAGAPRLPGLDEIVFAIPGAGPHTIALAGQLPNIVESINIDATTQPGYAGTPLIEIDGTAISSPGAAGITVLAKQSRVEGLAVGGFTGTGISVGNDNVVVSHCYAGVGPSGSSARPNGFNGILVTGGRNNRVEACLASGNSGIGVEVTGSTTIDTRIVGCRIGTNALGLAALPNAVGVRVGGGAVGTIIGGSNGSERCIISGNATHGVMLIDGVGTTIRGNYIGVSESGLGALPNADDGIHAVDGIAHIEPGNVISANGQSGCRLTQVTGSGWATIYGSSFGVAADGRSVLGNGEHGIVIVNGRADIGSVFSSQANVIAGNGLGGILLADEVNVSPIMGNYIGTNAFGDVLGQPGDGIRLEGATWATIGNGAPAGRNTIAYTGGAGIAIPAGTENWIRWNTIHATGGLPVDLGPTGPTLNDSGDVDTGANQLQNAPVLTGAMRDGASTIVTGVLDSFPSTDYRIELVERGTGPSTLGPLAFIIVETDAAGHVDFAFSFVATMQPGTRVAAFASYNPDFQPANGYTSEMSNAVPVQGVAYGSDTPGIFVAGTAAFFLKNANASGNADIVYTYGAAPSTSVPLVGDWNGDGVDSGGLYDPATGAFFLRNSSSPGPADLVFTFGGGGLGLVPLSGDWNGDGVDTIGLYAPATGAFFLRNSNNPGNADLVFTYGAGGGGVLPVTGDWNADGIDTVGIYFASSGAFFLRNANSAGSADLVFSFGAGGAGIVPVIGDWNGDGMDSIGIYGSASGVWFLKNLNAGGAADFVFGYGPPAVPLTGDWDGPIP